MAKGIGRNGELFKQLCDPAHLIRSAVAAAKGKRHKSDVAAYMLELEPNCFRLCEAVLTGSWTPGPGVRHSVRSGRASLRAVRCW